MRTRGGGLGGVDVPLMIYLALWYLGNYYYNFSNKLALKATGRAADFPMTISALQLGISGLYRIYMWLAPNAREKPTLKFDDVFISLSRGLPLIQSSRWIRWIRWIR